MSEQENTPVDTGQPEAKPAPKRNTPTVQFIEGELPKATRGTRGFHPRKSKYDAVYAALTENPGHWAFIGEGQSLYGALVGYRKRRELADMAIAYRNGAVYAGYQIPDAEEVDDDEDDDENGEDNEDDDDEAGDNEPAQKVQWPVSTGVESPVTAGTSENAGETSGQGGNWA